MRSRFVVDRRGEQHSGVVAGRRPRDVGHRIVGLEISQPELGEYIVELEVPPADKIGL